MGIKNSKYLNIVKLVFGAAAIIHLSQSQAYFSVYVLIFILFLACLILNSWKIPCKFKNNNFNLLVSNWNHKKIEPITKSQFITKIIFSIFLTLCILLGNYELIIILFGDPLNCILRILFLGIGCYFIWNEILQFVLKAVLLKSKTNKEFKLSFVKHFLFPWAIIFCVHFIFFLGNLPGYITYDGMNQIAQIINDTYSNHHPYWNTQIIHLFWLVGQAFDNANLGISLYLTFQIIVITCAFSYIIYTLFSAKVKPAICIIVCVLFCVLPVYIIFTTQLIKDIFFTASVCFFVVSQFRILKLENSNKIVNYIVLFVSGIAMCLFKSNGLFVFIVSMFIFVLLNIRQFKRFVPIGAVLLAVAMVGGVLKFPVLNALEVNQPDLIEHLSIPAQQVARVAVDCDDLSDEEQALINDVISIDKLKEVYISMFFDPIKEVVRKDNTQNKIAENKDKYIDLYISLGLKHPDKYFVAWIDQTKNYWNAGYPCWQYQNLLTWHPGEITIFSQVWPGNFIENLSTAYRNFSVDNLHILYSPGLYFWLVVIALFGAIIKKDKNLVISIVPIVVLWLSLMISTPTCWEFRYTYPLVCLWPFYYSLLFFQDDNSRP